MQVVYSGGSSTPTPSPRLQRKSYQVGYGRPILPGYLPGPPPPVVIHRSKDKLTEGDTSLRDSIPAMTKPVAIMCLVLNVLIPGMGTFTSGLTVLCCSEVRPKGATRKSVVWVNTGVALLQFLTAFLFLLGWIWSIMWGAAFLTIAKKYSKSKEVQHTHTIKISPKHERHYEEASTSTSRNNLTPYSNGTAKPVDDVYLTPSSANQTQPMITLQQPPIHHSADKPSPSRPLMNARTRHQKILQRQMSDNQLSPFTLTQEKLEAIVIHDIVPRSTRTSVQRTETVESVESVSDSDDPAGKS